MKVKALTNQQISSRLKKLAASGWSFPISRNNGWICRSPDGSLHDLSAADFTQLDHIAEQKSFLIEEPNIKTRELTPEQIHARMQKLTAAKWTKVHPNSPYEWICRSPLGNIHDLSAANFDALDEIAQFKIFIQDEKPSKPFDEDTTTVLIKYLNGENPEWEYVRHNAWEPSSTLRCDPISAAASRFELRLKPLTKPSINWDHVSPKYTHLATDANGQSYLYIKEPQTNTCGWFVNGYEFKCVHRATTFTSFTPGTIDWSDSLISRDSL